MTPENKFRLLRRCAGLTAQMIRESYDDHKGDQMPPMALWTAVAGPDSGRFGESRRSDSKPVSLSKRLISPVAKR